MDNAMNGELTTKQKLYLEGFTSGLQAGRTARGGGTVPGANGANGAAWGSQPLGPDAAGRTAQERFIAAGKKLSDPTGDDKTSLMFSVRDEAGILHRMLEPFAKRDINLSKIESRPLKRKAWEYIFYLDLSGHIQDTPVAEAVRELSACCQFVKVLGSYPRAR